MQMIGSTYTFDGVSSNSSKVTRDLPRWTHYTGVVRFNPDVYGSAEVGTEIDILYIIKNSTRCAYARERKLLHYCAIDMAAPDGTDILDVTGLWSLNRTLSDSLEETFALVS